MGAGFSISANAAALSEETLRRARALHDANFQRPVQAGKAFDDKGKGRSKGTAAPVTPPRQHHAIERVQKHAVQKAQSKCWACNAVGHVSRECKQKAWAKVKKE